MSQFSGLFQRIGSAKPPGDFLPRLGLGTHKVVLERYEPKLSDKNKQQVIVEADFTILESPIHQPMASHGWPFFPGSDEYGYGDGRAAGFIQTIGQCIGDTTPTDVLGDQLSSPAQIGRGVTLLVTVTQVFNRDGSPRLNRKGEPITNANFAPIPQDLASVAATRAHLDQIKPLVLNAQKQRAPQQGQGQPQWGQPAQPQQGYPNQGQPQGQPQWGQPPMQQQAQSYPPQGQPPTPQGPQWGAPQGQPQWGQPPAQVAQPQPGAAPGFPMQPPQGQPQWGAQPTAQPGAPGAFGGSALGAVVKR